MCCLIWIFSGRTCKFTRKSVPRLSWQEKRSYSIHWSSTFCDVINHVIPPCVENTFLIAKSNQIVVKKFMSVKSCMGPFIKCLRSSSKHQDCVNKTQATACTSYIIVIKHGFQCINIRQVPWEVLKTEAEGHVRSLLLHKNWKHLLHFALFLALFFFVFSPMSRERNFHGLCSF